MLRCEGCMVLHHPGCWVTNGGCATQSEHRIAPAAMAYSALERQPGAPAPHPGEGTRMAPLPSPEPDTGHGPIPFRGQRSATPPVLGDAGPELGIIGGPVAGGTPPASGAPMVRRTLPSTIGVPVSTAPKRYRPGMEEPAGRRKMPEIYDGHRLFRYWYVPAAILVAVAVASGVIWLGSALFGGDGDGKPADGQTPTPGSGSTSVATPQPSASASASVAPTGTPTTATGPGRFTSGETVVVTNTGDCLNVRVGAGRSNDAIVCVKDGTQMTVTGGPETAEGLTWWKVRTALGEGWAAEDYLVKQQ